MNRVPYTEKADYPLSSTDLSNQQDAYMMLASAFCSFLGQNAILSGCEVSGDTISEGRVCINGEVLLFKQSIVANFVAIRQVPITRVTDKGSYVTLYQRYAEATEIATSTRFDSLKKLSYLIDLATKADKIVEPRKGYRTMSIENNLVKISAQEMICDIDQLGNIHIRGIIRFKYTGVDNGADDWITLFNINGVSAMSPDMKKKIIPASPWSADYEGVVFLGLKPMRGLQAIHYTFRISKNGDFQIFADETDLFNSSYTEVPIYINVHYNNPLGV